MKAPIATAIAIAVGLVILLGYFIPIPALQDVRMLLLNWGVTLLGVAALVGMLNLAFNHVQKLFPPHGVKRDLSSLILLGAFIAALGLGLWLSPGDDQYGNVVTSIQAPIEKSLIAVLSISLLYGGFRLLQYKRNPQTIVFLISTILYLLLSSGFLSFLETVPVMNGVIAFMQQLPLGGARGILLGVALGSLLTGLRVLMGVDRPYGG